MGDGGPAGLPPRSVVALPRAACARLAVDDDAMPIPVEPFDTQAGLDDPPLVDAGAAFLAPLTTDAYGSPFCIFTYDSDDGLVLAGRRWGDASLWPAGAPARLPVVCLPGLTRNVRDFEPVAARLLSEGRPVVALDYRGRGLSEFADPATYTPVREALDVALGLDALGVRRAVFLGTSRGGLVSLVLATIRPDLIAGVIFNDVGPQIEVAGLIRLRDELAGRSHPPREARPSAFLSWDAAAALIEDRFRPIYPALDKAGFARLARRLFRDHNGSPAPDFDRHVASGLDQINADTVLPDLWEPYDALAARRVPVLAIRGALSDVLSEPVFRAMAKRSAAATLWTVADEGHTPLLEDKPTLDRIVAFLAHVEDHETPRVPSSPIASHAVG